MRVRVLSQVVAAAAVGLAALTGCGSSSSHTSTTNTAGSANSLPTLKAGVLKIGTANNIKPYAYEENGQLKGFEVDLIKAVAAKLNEKPELISMDFSALLPAVNNRQFDVVASAVGITPQRKQMVDFSDGYLAGYYGVVAGPSSGITKSVSSVAGKRVAVLQGSIEDTQSAKYLPGAQTVRFPDPNSADLALDTGRVAGFFTDYDTGISVEKKYPSAHFSMPVVISGKDYPAGWAVKKGNDALLGPLNTALKQVVADGTWLRLYKQYFPDEPVPSSSDLPPYTASS
jgi:polar amino acid transport system substrate-binding protein